MNVINMKDYMEDIIASSKVVHNLEIALDALLTAEKYLNKDHPMYKLVNDAFVNTDRALFELMPEDGLHNQEY
jgi:hypothetical protein